MKAKLHFVLSISMFFIAFSGWSQNTYWKSIAANGESKINLEVEKSSVFDFKETVFQEKLNKDLKASPDKLIYFPKASGEIIGFKVLETPVFHPVLAAKYPQIKSYTGWSEDKKHKIRFSSSPKGVQGMLLSVSDASKTTFIEKSKNSEKYIAYQRKSRVTNKDGFVCKTDDFQKNSSPTSVSSKNLVDDQTLRTYRIAVSATGQYTQYHGGSVADALAAINATLTRVNEIFEKDLSVRLQLIANNDLVIFTDPETDPYTDTDMLSPEVQNTLTTIIGEANYDVGQLFQGNFNGGDAGSIGAVCSDNRKGSAYTSGVDPQGDLFDIDYVAHELGHQFGANHTWSHANEETGVQAEPASGTTIMGYAGIVGENNVAPNGDDYFHYNSILQITDYLQTTSCAQTTSLTNSPPVISAVPDYTIPKGTAFVLNAEATDTDSEDILTYTWEQIDNGLVVASSFGPENFSGANFRSQKPTTNTERYFPKLSRIVQGNLTQTNPTVSSAWETVATIGREFNFAFTARDNAAGGGQVASELTKVTTINTAGPFIMTSQTSNEVYQAGSIQTITWDVANTNKAPINAASVAILLSLDGGVTFPLIIAESIPNTGNADIQLPGVATTSARIMVKAVDNIFLAVNASNFTIQESQVVLNFQELEFETCQPDDVIVPFTFETYSGFNEEITFSAINLPGGLTANFSPANTSTNNTSVNLTFSNTGSVAIGNYPILIRGTATGLTVDNTINLNIYNTSFNDVTLLSPSDLETNTRVNPQLQWQHDSNNNQYDIEIATDAAFTSIVESATVDFEFYQTSNLLSETSYFWRVRPRNSCDVGTFGAPFTFTTSSITCANLASIGLPLEISAGNPSTITSTISVIQDVPIADLDVDLEVSHTFLKDLIIKLTSPSGTTVTLLSKNCVDLNDINAVFDDNGVLLSCSSTSPTINGTIQPLDALSSFNGESSFGDWILEIIDTENGDGGSLDSFSLAICAEGELSPCFAINEPEALAVTSELIENSLQARISLEGGTLYNVEVNGVVTQTENSEIIVTLKPGVNKLKVFTNLPCQGIFEESLFVSISPIIYPNPVQEKLHVFLNQELENVNVQLFNVNGQLIYQNTENIEGANLELDFDTFSVGVYFLRVTGEKFKEEFKVLKK